MKKRILIPFVLTAILAAAHFLRDGNLVLVLFCLLFPLIVRVRKPWAWWAIQLFAWGSALLWVNVTFEIAQVRIIVGEPWGRMAAILGSVAILCVISAVLFWPQGVRALFGLGELEETPTIEE